eukprot:m.39927 g.39927  ORF g.39927 m.39927 type:complete len:221 (-) comp14770_c0_seq1:114-776(-)
MLCTSLFLLSFVAQSSSFVEEREPPTEGFKHVTCGSTIKLGYVPSAAFKLHSHEVSYGSGSGQQSVTLKSSSDDSNSFWTVFGGIDSKWDCKRGSAIKNGRIIRLQHALTKRWLHSHAEFKSPLSSKQEVSAYGSREESNTADNWRVEVEGGGFWMREGKVRLKHVDTGKYLYATGQHQFGHPIEGQREVSAAAAGARTPQGEWIALEGLYVKKTPTPKK